MNLKDAYKRLYSDKKATVKYSTFRLCFFWFENVELHLFNIDEFINESIMQKTGVFVVSHYE